MDGLVVTAVLQRAVSVGRLVSSDARAADRVAGRRIAEEGGVEAMRVGSCHVRLGGVVRHAAVAIHVAERLQRKSVRRDERIGLPLRIDRAEEEQPIAQDRAAEVGAGIAQLRADGIDGALDALHRRVGRTRGRCGRA